MTMSNKEYQRATRQFLKTFSWSNPIGVTFTFFQKLFLHREVKTITLGKRKPMSYSFELIDHDTAGKQIRHFNNILNKKIFGRAARRYGKCNQFVGVFEGSSDSIPVGLHYHCQIDRPERVSEQKFVQYIKDAWRQCGDWSDCDPYIDPAVDSGWLDVYCTKLRSKRSYCDDIDWNNIRIST